MSITIKTFKEAISIIKFELADDFKDAVNAAIAVGEANVAFTHKEKQFHFLFKKSPIEQDDLDSYVIPEDGFKLQVFFNTLLTGHLYLSERDPNEVMSQEDSCFVLDFIETQLMGYGFTTWLADNTKSPLEYKTTSEYIDATNLLLSEMGHSLGVLTDGTALNYTLIRLDPLEVITQVNISSKIENVNVDSLVPTVVSGTVEGLLKKLFSGTELDERTFRFPA